MSPPAPVPCSARSRELGEQPVGTTPEARGWLVVEQPGPWGREAALESHLDPAIGAALTRRTAEAGWRLVLVRAAGQHPDTGGRRQVLLADTTPGASWLAQGSVDDARELLEIPLGPGFGVRLSQPVLLVCTNGQRDLCCAVTARPLLRALAAQLPAGQVWEASHLGGHRFAPTALVLPHGLAYARLTEAATVHALAEAAAGRVVLEGYRGRSTWSRPAQAAEAAVRARTGERDADTLHVLGVTGSDPHLVEVGHADGRRWQVQVESEVRPEQRAQSCGKPPVPLTAWTTHVAEA